jgi:hypothetical protein
MTTWPVLLVVGGTHSVSRSKLQTADRKESQRELKKPVAYCVCVCSYDHNNLMERDP